MKQTTTSICSESDPKFLTLNYFKCLRFPGHSSDCLTLSDTEEESGFLTSGFGGLKLHIFFIFYIHKIKKKKRKAIPFGVKIIYVS